MKIIRKPGPAINVNEAIKKLKNIELKVGWFESSKYPDSTSVAYVATIQEYGYTPGHIPARLGMRTTARVQQAKWKQAAQIQAKKMVQGKLTGVQAAEGLSLKIAGDMRKRISQVNSPPLSDVTILLRKWKRKGEKITRATVGKAAATLAGDKSPSLGGVSTKPLVDTRYLINTLTSTVIEK